MNCSRCFGTGFVLRRSWPGNELLPYPCEADGCVAGIASCCDAAGSAGNVPDESVHPALRVIGDLTPILKDQNGQVDC